MQPKIPIPFHLHNAKVRRNSWESPNWRTFSWVWSRKWTAWSSGNMACSSFTWANLVTTNQFSGGFSFQRKDWEKVTKSAWPMSLRGGQGHFTYLVALISLRSHLFLPESYRKISEFVGEMSSYLVISNGTVEPCHDSQGERLIPSRGQKWQWPAAKGTRRLLSSQWCLILRRLLEAHHQESKLHGDKYPMVWGFTFGLTSSDRNFILHSLVISYFIISLPYHIKSHIIWQFYHVHVCSYNFCS